MRTKKGTNLDFRLVCFVCTYGGPLYKWSGKGN